MPKDSEDKCRERGEAPRFKDLIAGSLQAAPVAHAGGACRLAAPAAEARLEMLQQRRIVGAHLAPLQGPHQNDASPRAVTLVSGDEVGGACRKAETAMHAWVES
jgi:hypothetical protein